jgi:hypothetical protein
METSENMFDMLLQELLKQKQRFEDLVAENQELRHQLTSLRAGQGLVVDILGKRFILSRELISSIEDTVISRAIRVPPPKEQTGPRTPVPPPPDASLLPLPRTMAPSATTRPLTTDFAGALSSSRSEEEDKATLRRDLMESFVLS